MKILRVVAIAAIVCGLCSAGPVTFDLNSSLGFWDNILLDGTHTGGTFSVGPPQQGLNGVGTNVVRWGDTSAGDSDNPSRLQSGYEYNAVAPPTVPGIPVDTLFKVGTFVHENQAITPGTSVLGATLNITMMMDFSGTPVNKTFAYHFAHNETDNAGVGGICPFGGGPVGECPDFVTILNSVPDTNFVVGGQLYTLELIGFSKDGGLTKTSSFESAERSNNPADLFATITAPPPSTLPEPGTLFLFAPPLAAFVVRRLWLRRTAR